MAPRLPKKLYNPLPWSPQHGSNNQYGIDSGHSAPTAEAMYNALDHHIDAEIHSHAVASPGFADDTTVYTYGTGAESITTLLFMALAPTTTQFLELQG